MLPDFRTIVGHIIEARKWAARRIARATTVSVGFAWLQVGNTAAEQTYKFESPCTAKRSSTTPAAGCRDIRAVPM